MELLDPAQWWALLNHFETALLYGVLPVIIIALTVMALSGVTLSWKLMKFAFLFAILGAGFGLLLGASREPAVKAFLPAIITLIGGVVIYVFPQKADGMSLLADEGGKAPSVQLVRNYVMVALASLVVSSVAGANFGSSVRADHEAFLRQEARDLLLYEAIELPIERDQLRRALGLPLAAGQ